MAFWKRRTPNQDAAPGHDNANAPLILVADDDQLVRSLLTTGLDRSGFRVIEAVDGPSALDAMRASMPALVLLDWMMPGMPGVDGLPCDQVRSPRRRASTSSWPRPSVTRRRSPRPSRPALTST